MASQGEKLFQQLGCSTCHLMEEQGRCPILKNVFGSRVLLQDGRTVLADETYIRESILNPNAKIVADPARHDADLPRGILRRECCDSIAYMKVRRAERPMTANSIQLTYRSHRRR